MQLSGAIETAAKDGILRLVETLLFVEVSERLKPTRSSINVALQLAAQLDHSEVVEKLLAIRSVDHFSDLLNINAVVDAAEEGEHEFLTIILFDAKNGSELERAVPGRSCGGRRLLKGKSASRIQCRCQCSDG